MIIIERKERKKIYDPLTPWLYLILYSKLKWTYQTIFHFEKVDNQKVLKYIYIHKYVRAFTSKIWKVLKCYFIAQNTKTCFTSKVSNLKSFSKNYLAKKKKKKKKMEKKRKLMLGMEFNSEFTWVRWSLCLLHLFQSFIIII